MRDDSRMERLAGVPREPSSRPRALPRGVAHFALALPLALMAGKCPAEAVIIKTDCLEATAIKASKSGGGISVRRVDVETGEKSSSGEDCPDLLGAKLTLYRESGDRPGYQEGEDTFVSVQSGKLDTASGKLVIGSFTTQGSGQTADSWTSTITTTSGDSVFEGSF